MRYVAPRCLSILLLLHLQGVVRVAMIQDDSQPHQHFSRQEWGEVGRRRPCLSLKAYSGSCTHYFYTYLIKQNLIIWPLLTTRSLIWATVCSAESRGLSDNKRLNNPTSPLPQVELCKRRTISLVSSSVLLLKIQC